MCNLGGRREHKMGSKETIELLIVYIFSEGS